VFLDKVPQTAWESTYKNQCSDFSNVFRCGISAYFATFFAGFAQTVLGHNETVELLCPQRGFFFPFPYISGAP
jgi:hypothetical protein